MDTSNIDMMIGTLDAQFHISLWAVLPAVMMLIVSVKKVPAILGLTGCVLFSIVFAMLLQGIGFKDVMMAGFSGYHSDTGVALVDAILSRGGLTSMMNTTSLIILTGIMGGALNASGVIGVFVEKGLMRLVHQAGTLVVVTMIYSYFILGLSGNQVLGLVMGGTTFKESYKDMDLHKKVLSRALADTTTVAAPLVPWSTACVYTMGVLGVTHAYIPYAVLCYTVPIFTIICAFTGIGMWHADGTPFHRKKESKRRQTA